MIWKLLCIYLYFAGMAVNSFHSMYSMEDSKIVRWCSNLFWPILWPVAWIMWRFDDLED